MAYDTKFQCTSALMSGLANAERVAKTNGNEFHAPQFAHGIGFIESKTDNPQNIMSSGNHSCLPDTVDSPALSQNRRSLDR